MLIWFFCAFLICTYVLFWIVALSAKGDILKITVGVHVLLVSIAIIGVILRHIFS